MMNEQNVPQSRPWGGKDTPSGQQEQETKIPPQSNRKWNTPQKNVLQILVEFLFPFAVWSGPHLPFLLLLTL